MPTGIYPRTQITREKMSQAQRGHHRGGWKLSEETRRKMSVAKKAVPMDRRYFLGKHHSEETKKRISEAKRRNPFIYTTEIREKIRNSKLGKKMSTETRKKLADAIRGEKSHLWKGGVTEKNKLIRNSLEYRLWREAVFERDDWTCRGCSRRGGVELHPDHIKPFAYFPELRFELSNGRTLCIDCHRKTDTYASRARKNYAGS